MPQAIMATTAMTKPADSQHMKDRSRSTSREANASAAALQFSRGIDPRYLRPLPFFRLALITPADPKQECDGRDNQRGNSPIDDTHDTTPVAR